ncbi:outer membrane protein assembly factor BamB family protein, partial [Actinoallomurus acaciae]
LGALLWWPRPRTGRRTPAAAPPRSPAAPPPRPAQRWKRRTGADHVELAATDDVLLALIGETVRGLDPRTGKVLWKRVHSFSPTGAGDIAYVLASEATRIAAIRAASGRTLWTSGYYHQVLGDDVAVTGPVVCVGTDGVSAVNARDGRPRWTSKVSGKYGISGADGLVVAVSSTAMTGIDAGTGRTRWTYPMDYGDYQLIGEGMAFASDRFGTLHAVHAGTGAPAWRRPDVKSWSGQVGGGLVFVEGRYGDVLALRTTTGEVAWSHRPTRAVDDPRGQATAPGLAGGTLYVASTDGRMYALGAADGRLQWIYDAERPMRIRPVSVGGLVFVATMDGYIRALVPPAGATSRSGGTRGGP